MKTKKLPKKASDLILLALEDLRKVERSSKYRVDMNHFHKPNSKCKVCFAGAIISYSLKVDINEYVVADDFDKYTGNRLVALDEFRKGEINVGLYSIDNSGETYYFNNIKIVKYEVNKGRFKRQMKSMAIMLQKNNL